MKHPIKSYLLIGLFAGSVYFTAAQGYQAIHGSPYAGSTAAFNNPASPVHSAYQWHLGLFSSQFKLTTNSAYIRNFSALGNRTNAELIFNDGYKSRYAHANMDMSLFTFLYKPDNTRAFTVGLRARTYNHVKTMPFNVDSTMNSLNSFLIFNRNTPFAEGFTTHVGWLEADLTYSQVLSVKNGSQLSGGITLQVMKGVSGAYLKANRISYLEQKNTTDTSYTFTSGTGSVGYSSNYDEAGSVKEFVQQSRTGLALSLGIEYLVYNSLFNMETPNNLNYDWKIGLSLLDFGVNSFRASEYSSQLSDPDPSITDAQIVAKLGGAPDVRAIRDSLNTLFSTTSSITNNFTISNPARFILNIDRNLGNHFYVNGELSMNLYSTSGYDKLRTRELNLLTITPRWETIGFGAYLPVQYTTQGQLWVGAALKLGPLVLGFHNLGLLKKDPTLNGGGYLMLSLHPFSKKEVVSKLDCMK